MSTKTENVTAKDIETERFEETLKLMLNEFDEIDDGEGDDSWWWEEGRQQNSSPVASPVETDYTAANLAHKNLAPAETRKPFNSYEQCNRLIISTQTRGELLQRFCDIIDGLTEDNEEAQQKLIDMVNSVTNL